MSTSLIAVILAAATHVTPACPPPSPDYRAIAGSATATIFERRHAYLMRGCQHGHALVKLAKTADRRLTVTRGRWVAYPVTYITDEGKCATGCYDLVLAELRRGGRFRWYSLPGDGLNTPRVSDLALGAHGVVLFAFRRQLTLFGRTPTRFLANDTPRSITQLRVRGRTASWVQDGQRRAVHFTIEPGHLRH